MQFPVVNDRQSSILSTIKEYGSNLFGFIRGKVRTREEAEDVLQDVWFQLSRIIDLGEIDNISGWLYRVARNNITDRFRKKDLELFSDQDDSFLEVFEVLTETAETPEELFYKDMFWQELQRALDELPENQRNTFVWNELEDKTLQEIADLTSENLKTVISRKRYAVKHLRGRLKELYEELKN
ncbi:MAG: RNA polymerase sigma factor (sigma-70 family) [Cyclobacteriaceae bacterium]|jgi:RNA polymerase sigma factor (sigma-70 family)